MELREAHADGSHDFQMVLMAIWDECLIDEQGLPRLMVTKAELAKVDTSTCELMTFTVW